MKAALILIASLTVASAFSQNLKSTKGHENNPYYSNTDTKHLDVKNSEWKKILSPSLYAVAREADTEPAFTGTMWKSTTRGSYYCAVCGNALFKSEAKFVSECGWPSFFEAIRKNSVNYKEDNSFGMSRIEVECARCDSHLGHIFDDGPPPTGKRFCINAISVDFAPELGARK
jgi:peptide-methionine (R)-S-oxide reductase